MSAAPSTPYSPLEGESKRSSRFGGGMGANPIAIARKLRKAQTPWEKKLWVRLKADQLGVAFRRQQPIGAYIVDFACLELKLVIELDGSQHQGQASDAVRDEWLVQAGYTVLRFWNNEVDEQIDHVLERILVAVTPHQNAKARFDSPSRGE